MLKRLQKSRLFAWDVMDYSGPKEPLISWGSRSPTGRGSLPRHLRAHCEVQGIFGVSQSYSIVGSSDAVFRCQYCSNLIRSLSNSLRYENSVLIKFSQLHADRNIAVFRMQIRDFTVILVLGLRMLFVD